MTPPTKLFAVINNAGVIMGSYDNREQADEKKALMTGIKTVIMVYVLHSVDWVTEEEEAKAEWLARHIDQEFQRQGQ
jgi:hypothetical protein